MEGKKDYSAFYEAVKEGLELRLACYKLSDEEMEQYMREEERQIKGAYESYISDCCRGILKEDAFFKASVSSVAFCLEMCY